MMDVDYGYGVGTKARLDNEREGTIVGRCEIIQRYKIGKKIKSIDHYYIFEFKNGHSDWLRNKDGRFGECFVNVILVHVENITPKEVIE